MSDEKLEQIVSAIEAAFVFAGATDFDDGLVTAKKLIAPFYESLQCLETRADLKAALAACDEATSGELAKVLVLMQNLPSVTRFGFTSLAKAAAATLPPLPSGRPSAIPSEKCAEVLDFISSLNRKGCKLMVAKERAAQRYGVSRRSIERLWTRRSEYGGEDTSIKVTMEEALQYLATGK